MAVETMRSLAEKVQNRHPEISKHRLLSFLPTLLSALEDKFSQLLGQQRKAEEHRIQVDQGTQIQLMLKYRELAQRGERLHFSEVGFKNFSHRIGTRCISPLFMPATG